MRFDPDLLGPDLDESFADFDTLDAIEADAAQSARVIASGLPARPGTRR